MTPIQKLIDRLTRRSSTDQDADIVLGLPLESGEKTIYPVFVDPGTQQRNGAHPRQIGYLEVSENRSDFTSLEPNYRMPLMFTIAATVLLLTAWLLIRLASGNRNERVS